MKRIRITLGTIFAVLLITASYTFAGAMHTGKVLETTTGGGYSYMLVEESGKRFWIAGPETKLGKGALVSFDEQMWMHDFQSKALNRKFDSIMFVGVIQPAQNTMAAPSAGKATVNASGPATLYPVRELFAKKDELNGQEIKVKGTVIKVSSGIMGMSWVHVQDGTVYQGQDKIIFTSRNDTARVGAEITAQGKLITDKDFGAGYFYPVIIEDSTFSK